MKRLLIIALILLSSSAFAFAQETPLTQTEYVKMLYALPKNPAGKTALIEAIRKRGIAFEVTSGIIGLTTSKSGNDSDLRRTLEEAGRRKADPTKRQLPSAKDAAEVLEKTKQNTLAAVEEMPDFVVKQAIQRSASHAGTNNFRSQDRLVVAVSYQADGNEEYKLLTVNGVPTASAQGSQTYEQAGGATTSGEFVTALAKLFQADSKTEFNLVDTDTLRGRPSLIFEYSIKLENNKFGTIGYKGLTTQSAKSAERGKIWIDREKSRIIRIEAEAIELPADFPVRAFSSTIDYDWATIGDEKYLLPLLSEARFTARVEGGEMIETRNIIKFKDYQKYGTDVIILDEDTESPAEDAPKQ